MAVIDQVVSYRPNKPLWFYDGNGDPLDETASIEMPNMDDMMSHGSG